MLRSAIASMLWIATGLSAQTIDVSDYLPLGSFNTWRVQQDDDASRTRTVQTKKVEVVDGVLRYTVSLPILDDLEEVNLVLGVDDGLVLLYSMRLSTDELPEISAQKLSFDPPVVLGNTATDLDLDEFENDVDTAIQVKLKLGPLNKTFDVLVIGTITAIWESVLGDFESPLGLFDAADLALMLLDIDLTFEIDDFDADFDEDLSVTVGAILAEGVGFVGLADKNFDLFSLERAILPGVTLGDFPPLDAGMESLDLVIPDVLSLDGASAGTSTGGDFVLSDVRVMHELSGRLTLTGRLSEVEPAPQPADPGPAVMHSKSHSGSVALAAEEDGALVSLTGKARTLKDGGARVKLKGKSKVDGFAKPFVLRARQDVDAGGDSLTITYKSGSDVAGSMQLALLPVTAGDVHVTLDGLVDSELEQRKKARKLGSDGIMTLGSLSIPVTVFEKLKNRDGKPDAHVYTLRQTGLSKTLMRFRARSDDGSAYELSPIRGRLLGRRFKAVATDFELGTDETPAPPSPTLSPPHLNPGTSGGN